MENNKQIYTYFIQAEKGGLIKIGKTTNLKSQLEKIQGQCPIKLEYIYIIENDLESILHDQFNEFRVHHKWFKPNTVISFINDLKNGKITLVNNKIEAEMKRSMNEHIYKESKKQKIEYVSINEYLNEYEHMLIDDL